ncbi:Uroporphyrin-III C/tetrapyrrole (Corrin/Porphyrin) methyltransferase [Acidimicrobium ferrooxidans DSM 10331]|uniref:Uroporphyrin-III C/tetrapyrrole (Corrin/Porphyrin) methyltransferase n=1 Tax=Acidimicrobium ferrooxidans (strain DSM 10331 / JCM 15462 / NBRC 103882 / ICP) TaxID=525909 RepID=C7M397_ACIFD|nr:16S rRNA (cytidine(1402)-2'-O)-methyltransferase [Acidimicrobium ferrooxidans]ACU53491.1 Uroporphyrin-III C/tetrapyrrole (Corrin/Porphyrin) methyltransferase [Acidimicrobium ferrooxidans DSM 10331]
MSGVLSVAGTPIGNLADASPRLRSALETADLVVCEDTRVTRRLASALGIRLRAVRALRGQNAIEPEALATHLLDGEHVVLVVDAGMPGTSDPGAPFVATARAVGATVVVIPGPSAATAVMALWPHEVARYCVAGFLPQRGAERGRLLADLLAEGVPTVVFEAPNRILELVDAIGELDPEREVLLAKELTKIHETSFQGTARAAGAWARAIDRRGEWVVVVGPARVAPPTSVVEHERLTRALAESSLAPSEAARIVARLTNAPRQEAYAAILAARPDARPSERPAPR